MWGNRLGWIISGIMLAVFGSVLALGSMPGTMEASTGTLAPVGMKVLAPPIDPLTVFKQGTSEEDAGPLYRQAMEDYDTHQDQYAAWEKAAGSVPTDPPPAGVQKILDARDCGKMDLFAKNPKELINYENNTPSIDAIHHVAHIADDIALLAAARKDNTKARRYGEALMALGYNLTRERLRFTEWNEGMQIMQWGAADIAKGDPGSAKHCQDFINASDTFMKTTIGPFWEKLDGIDPQRYSGDIYELAQSNNPETMWRVEAILRLGRLTYFARTRGDQLVARHFLARLVTDTTLDPLTKTAADAANEIVSNPAEYNKIGLSTQ